ncbi:MAG: glucan biosynthesis protein G [Wenzhouxiangella sp.]|jgi:glucans biosynthesis protein|nr:glucan biosynthesis protein G [Wenzhouxiangella sp.]
MLLMWASTVDAFDLSDVVAQAETLAAQPWQTPIKQPAELADLTYDEYRAIRFDPSKSLWVGSPGFRVQFFHPGFLFGEPVRIFEVEDGSPSGVPFTPERFRFDPPLTQAPVVAAEGYAGFRVHFPLNRADIHDEFLVFLGASYFRFIGQGQAYGLSARGLALDSGVASREEFPVFRAFWLVKPEAEQTNLRVLALLDSPSVTGAYAFDIEPGVSTTILVEAHLFARKDLVRPGIAPLTSMFAHGDTGPTLVDDFRPRVHDSDGLLVHSSRGEAQWRPLANRARVAISAFSDDGVPRGFGLLQRHGDLDDFQDLEARYDLRPGKWVEPLDGDWGAGRVELIEIPTADETFDNIVAFWTPEEPILAGESRYFRYRLTTTDAATGLHPRVHVRQTLTGRGGIPGQPDWSDRSKRRFVIEFSGEGLDDSSRIDLVAETRGGNILEQRLERVPGESAVRAVLVLKPDEQGLASDLRVFLARDGDQVSEVWSYVWYPDEQNRQI